MNQFAKSLAAAALITLAPLSAAAQDKVVNVYNWSDYVGEGVLDDFTKETGIKVVYDVYDSNEMLETKLLAGGSGYDIIVPSDRNLARMIQAGVVQKLDKSKIPNLANVWPAIAERLATYDPGNEYAVNYMWGTTAIGYNVAKIKERMPDAPVNSWDMIFKPEVIAKFADCGVQVLDSPDDMIPAALHYLGLDPNSKDPGELQKAGDLLKSIRPSIQKFHSSEYINGLANGDICMAVGYSGDILQARDRAAEAGSRGRGRLLHPEGGRADLARCDEHPGRRAARRRGARVHQLHEQAGDRGAEFQLRLLCERQSCLAAIPRRGREERQGRLSRRGDVRQALRDDGGMPARAARDHAHLDGGEDGPVRSVPSRVARMEPCASR